MRYYLPTEVVLHNKPDDVWVSFLGKVWDVTPVVNKFKSDGAADCLIANAGKDISHWFDPETKDIKRHIHNVTGLKSDYTPQGPIPQTNLVVPADEWLSIKNPPRELPWWRDSRYQVGVLTKKPRPVRVVNTLVPPPHRNNLIWVAAEETVMDIINRVCTYNSHAHSYTVKYCGVTLHPHKTLEQNGIPDERDRFTELGIPDDNYIPALILYYNDDLTRT